MRLLSKVTTIEHRSGTHLVTAIGDVHVGSVNCHYEQFCKDIREIKEDPNRSVILMGDLVDAIGTQDPRYTVEGIDSRFMNQKALRNLPRAQCDYVIKKLDPIRDQIVMLLTGNHEMKVKKFSAKAGYEFDPTDYIAEALGLQDVNVDYVGALKWGFRSEDCPGRGGDVVTIVAQHGFGGGRLKGGKIANMDRALNGVEADCFLMGHTHELMAARKVRNKIVGRGDKVEHQAHDMLMVNTGTYLKTYQSSMDYKQSEYGEVMMYEPTHIGCARLSITPRYGMVRVCI